MSKKSILLVLLACFLILGASFGITYSYLISEDTESNAFTAGETVIEVHEEYEPPPKLEPDTTITKKPKVKNTGNLPCFVRMRADFSDSKAEAFCEPLAINADWEYKDDGYYYYIKPLMPGAETSYLFEKIVIKSTDEGVSENDMIDFDVLVYAEARQQGEYSDDEYMKAWSKEGDAGAG